MKLKNKKLSNFADLVGIGELQMHIDSLFLQFLHY
jgi:hypothetical protein